MIFSRHGEHAEEQPLDMPEKDLLLVRIIGLNYSPCYEEHHKQGEERRGEEKKCAVKIVKKNEELKAPKPAIRFFWVHNYPKDCMARCTIRYLVKHDFILKSLDTVGK